MSELTTNGKEFFDQTPITSPLVFERPVPLHLRLRDQILQAMQLMRSSQDFDTPEEADDFNLDDAEEVWASSPYEVDFDHIENGFEKSDSAKSADILPHDEAEKGNSEESANVDKSKA